MADAMSTVAKQAAAVQQSLDPLVERIRQPPASRRRREPEVKKFFNVVSQNVHTYGGAGRLVGDLPTSSVSAPQLVPQ